MRDFQVLHGCSISVQGFDSSVAFDILAEEKQSTSVLADHVCDYCGSLSVV